MWYKRNNASAPSSSLGRITWKRFRRNKTAMAGLLFILFTALLSILGYLIIPDKSPNANEQKPELHILSPGSKVNFLLVRRNEIQEPDNWFSRMLFGSPSPYQRIPYRSLSFRHEKVLLEEFDEDTSGSVYVRELQLADVLYALDKSQPVQYDSLKQSIRFKRLLNSMPVEEQVLAMREKLLAEHRETRYYLLGSDILGRDLLSRLVIGARISLSVGFISVFISLLIGITLGALAGYYRGFLDTCIMWFINLVWSIPTLLLVIAITLVLGKGVLQVFIAVGLTMWVEVARMVRGQILTLREKEFVEAGRALGYRDSRIIFRHILPNVMGPVIVIAAGNFASAILMEAGLSFLGIGAQPPVPSWGEMINAHRGYILMDKAYLAFIPGLAIMALVLAFMMIGNGLRDALDTRSGGQSPLL